MANEAFARIKIDQLLKDADWSLTDGRSGRFEYVLYEGGKADCALYGCWGTALAVPTETSTAGHIPGVA